MSAPNYPLTLDVAGRKCVVVGAGPVGARRATALVDAGALVTVIAPQACEQIVEASAGGHLTWAARDYLSGDLDGAWLVHAATGLSGVDAQVAMDAQWSRIWCVRASDAEQSSAWVPAVSRVEDILVAVNAGGDPRRAVNLRDAITTSIADGTLPTARVRGVGSNDASSQGAGSSDAASVSTGSRRIASEQADSEHIDPLGPSPRGSVALIGGGPGDAGLLTVRALEILREADVVIFDFLAPDPAQVFGTMHAPDVHLPGFSSDTGGWGDVELIDVGKRAGDHPVPQDEINALLVDRALAGKRVARLKGGDPYVFGRGGEELDACRVAGIEVEVVSGVTSAISVPAAAGIPVTHRGLSRGFTVLTGHADIGKIPAASDHTLVLLMGLSRLDLTCAGLISRGHDPNTPAAVLEDGFGTNARTTVGTLATISERARLVGARTPAITVIGDVVTRSPSWPPTSDPALSIR